MIYPVDSRTIHLSNNLDQEFEWVPAIKYWNNHDKVGILLLLMTSCFTNQSAALMGSKLKHKINPELVQIMSVEAADQR